MRKPLMLIVASLMLAGCVPTVYTRPGGTVGDFERDRARCDYETHAATINSGAGYNTAIGGAFAQALAQTTLLHKCLAAHGWKTQQAAR